MSKHDRQSSLDTPATILRYNILSFVIKWIGTLTLSLSIMVLLLIFTTVDSAYYGIWTLLFGLSLSSIAATIMAIPSIPWLYRRSAHHQFIENLSPIWNALNNGNTIQKSHEKFDDALYAFEALTDDSFDQPEQITPRGYQLDNSYYLITGIEIGDTKYDMTPDRLEYLKDRLERQVEINCYEVGAKILIIGFLLQVFGTLIMNDLFL